METRTIQLPPEETTQTKKIKKDPVKRQITTTPQWTFEQSDLEGENQIAVWKTPTPFSLPTNPKQTL